MNQRAFNRVTLPVIVSLFLILPSVGAASDAQDPRQPEREIGCLTTPSSASAPGRSRASSFAPAHAYDAVSRDPTGPLVEEETALVSIQPVTSTVKAGQTLTVSVVISDVVNLGAFQFEMHYDPTVVQAEDGTLGSFLGSTGRAVGSVGPAIDNEVGEMSFGAYSFGFAAGPDGSGRLAELILTAQGAGSSPLDLHAVQIFDPAAHPKEVTVADGTALVTSETYLPLIARRD